MFQTILWVTDFSLPARHAGRRALQCAECSHGTLYVLAVVDPEDLPVILDEMPDPFLKGDQAEAINLQLEQEYEQKVMEELKKEVASLGPTQVPVVVMVRVGTPWKEVVRVAEELDVTLIVLGARGKRSLENIILGSTAENVARHAPCPVMIVR
jgi:nucleotide-binding universal stress UspA family protein